jgi:glyoxylase-like metal-dependent hydrolase (beta-lactamase superfamily II)
VSELPYDQLVEVTPYASLVLQNNPGLMTLDGTNTWLLRAPGADRTILVDPGQKDASPDELAHLDAVLNAAGDLAAVILTHGHFDHCEIAQQVHDRTGAPIRAIDPSLCVGAGALRDGEVIEDAGLRFEVWATPGHSADSASFVISEFDGQLDGQGGAVLTGDTVLGRGTTVVSYPDGDLGSYLASLRRLRELGDLTVLPGHGPVLEHAPEVVQFYLDHREQRLEQVRGALRVLGPDVESMDVVRHVYTDVDEALWPFADLSVQAQLAYLRGER